MTLEAYLRAAPKAELHLHLEGSIQPPTLLTLARRNGARLPARTVLGLERWFAFRDFPHFMEVYAAISNCLRSAEDYELITVELGAQLSAQNVRYAEVTFTPGTHHKMRMSHAAYFDGLATGRERVRREHGVEINWVFDFVRSEGQAEYTVDVAIDGMADGVVALGMGGPEQGYPPEQFARHFDRARTAGLHSTPHAGEFGGPEAVWAVVRELGAERIGHGVRSIEDSGLVAHLAEWRLPLELCPISNLRLGLYPSLDQHPLRRLHEAGVVVTVNSDDPALFNTSLTEQVLALASGFHFDPATIDEILLNGVRCSFLSEERKRELEAEFRGEMGRLGARRAA